MPAGLASAGFGSIDELSGYGGGVQEVGVAAPDIIYIRVNDQPIIRRPLYYNGGYVSGLSTQKNITNVASGASSRVRLTVTGHGVSTNNEIHIKDVTNLDEGRYFANVIDANTIDLLYTTYDGSMGTTGVLNLYSGNFITMTNPYTGASGTAIPVGRKFDHLWFDQGTPTKYLNRSLIQTAANWPKIGARTVSSVGLKTRPYMAIENLSSRRPVTMQHEIFLKLDANLSSGTTYPIRFPNGSGIRPYSFAYDDAVTRAVGIRTTQLGRRAGDASKVDKFGLWCGDLGTEGILDLSGYGLTGANKATIIDSLGSTCFTFNVTQISGPTDPESGKIGSWGTPTTTISAAADNGSGLIRLTVASSSFFRTNDKVFIYNGHSSANGIKTITVIDSTHVDIQGSTFAATSTGSMAGLFMYSSLSQTAVAITDIDKTATPVRLTVPGGHGLSNGDLVRPYNIGGSIAGDDRTCENLNGAEAGSSGVYGAVDIVYVIANSAATTVDLVHLDGTNVDITAQPAFAGGGGTLHRVTKHNSTRTYTYDLDWSALTSSDLSGKTGPYRVRIPGLGVSDSFRIDEGAWHYASAGHAAGEYHQRHGLRMDGRYGWSTRNPKGLDGQAGVKVYWSNIPYAAMSVDGWGDVPMSAGSFPPYLTTNRAYGVGGYFDAADWDSAANAHISSTWNILDLDEHFDSVNTTTNFNSPKANEMFPGGTWSGTDSLPDLVHMAIWACEHYRLNQQVDGRTNSGWHGGPDPTNTDPGQNFFEPSYITRSQYYAAEGDHVSGFHIAAVFAKLAQRLEAYGFTTQAALYETAAINLYNWSDGIYTNSTTRDTYYKTTLGLQTNAGWSDGTYNSWITTLHNNGITYIASIKCLALASLFKLTGTSSYDTAFRALWSNTGSDPAHMAMWEYVNTAGANAAYITANEVTNVAALGSLSFYNGTDLLATTNSIAKNTYQTGQSLFLNSGNFGGSGSVMSYSIYVMRAHMRSVRLGAANHEYLKVLQSVMAHWHGVNQSGLCFLMQMGARNVGGALQNDAHLMGGEPVPKGQVTYYYGNFGQVANSLGPNFAYGPANAIVDNPDPQFSSTFELQRTLYPTRHFWPVFEPPYHQHFCVGCMEMTWGGCVGLQLVCAAYLHGWDGNTTTS